MKSKLSHIEKVHFHEIPSIRKDFYDRLYLTHGLHVIISFDKDRYHKLFISASYKTDCNKYDLLNSNLSNQDLLAFHIFLYIKERCYFGGNEWKVLWKLLRYTNSLIQTIRKFYQLMKSYNKTN